MDDVLDKDHLANGMEWTRQRLKLMKMSWIDRSVIFIDTRVIPIYGKVTGQWFYNKIIVYYQSQFTYLGPHGASSAHIIPGRCVL